MSKLLAMLMKSIIETVSGTTPLALSNAKNRYMKSGKIYGICSQSGTPTPTTPVDIVCNNGAIKAKHQSGLPIEYQKVEYIESSATQYIDTGVKGTQNTKVDIDFQSTAAADGTFLPFGARSSASTDCFAIWSANSNVGGKFRIGFDSSAGYTGGNIPLHARYHIIHSKDGTYVNNALVWTTERIVAFTTPQNLLVFGYYNNATTMSLSPIRLFHLKLWEAGALVRDFIPCYRKSDNEAGLYDLVTNTFFTNAGTGSFVVGSDIADPVEVYADGTPEVLTVCGKNIFDQSLFDTDTDRTIVYKTFDVPNGTYTMSTNLPLFNSTTCNVFIGAGTTLSPSSANNGVSYETPQTITVTNGKYTVGYRSKSSISDTGHDPKDFNWQLELGSTATTYEPYSAQTASVENLLAVGDYKDEQDIISGLLTRRIGVAVFDGTETNKWNVESSRVWVRCADLGISVNNNLGTGITTFCSHFDDVRINRTPAFLFYFDTATAGITTVEQWNAFLAAQYAAGTPIIVVYPLSNETTEQVQAQPIIVQIGTNIVTSSLGARQAEIKYIKKG